MWSLTLKAQVLSYFSTNLDFVYLCLPSFTFVYLCLPLFKWRIYAQIFCLFLVAWATLWLENSHAYIQTYGHIAKLAKTWIYDTWYMLYDIWYIWFEIWNTIYDIWHKLMICMIYDVWNMSLRWYIVYDMIFEIPYMIYGIWNIFYHTQFKKYSI